VTEAVRAGRTRRVMIAREAKGSQGLTELLEAARAAGLVPEEVPRSRIDALGIGDHQEVAAVVRPAPDLDERALSGFAFDPDAIAVLLDGVTDPQNLGAAARAAEAAGAAMLITRTRRAAPVSPAAIRASAGALLHLPHARVANLTRAIDRLKERGFLVVGLDERAASSIHDASIPARPLLLVVGSEGAGMSRLVREACDELVAIPTTGKVGSLNASAALAVALFGYALRPAGGPPAPTEKVRSTHAGVAQSGSASDL
jgi:23S rRNA (guanosine2251-2'-O)-methyltransferase